jgi:V/A-type H+-transporting ATPase subunit D
LQRRLVVAARGASLLEQKLQILRAETQRLRLLADRTERAWIEASVEADLWATRAALLSGERGLRFAEADDHAEVAVDWADTMGVRYPAGATCSVLPRPPAAPPDGSAALAAARSAYERALNAAVQHAAALTAKRILETEDAATRRRVRALNDRWRPRLTTALHDLELALEEQERAEGVRFRWASGALRRRGDSRAGRGAR